MGRHIFIETAQLKDILKIFSDRDEKKIIFVYQKDLIRTFHTSFLTTQ